MTAVTPPPLLLKMPQLIFNLIKRDNRRRIPLARTMGERLSK
jgi:hypothetical protein